MATNNKLNDSKQKTSGSKFKIFKIASIIVVFLLVLIVLTPSLISLPAVTSLIQTKLAASLEADIEINDLKVTWFEGITVTGVSYADKNGIIVDAQRAYFKVSYMSLLAGIVNVSEGLIENATITIVTDENNPRPDTDNAAKIAALFIPDSRPFALAKDPTVNFELRKFNYINIVAVDLQNVTVVQELIKKDKSRQSFALSGIEGKIRINPPGQTSGIDLKGKTPGEDSSLTLYALAARPKMVFIKDEFSCALKVNINQFDLGNAAPLLYMAGSDLSLAGIIDFTLDSEVEKGLVKKCRGTLNSKQIDFAGDDSRKIVIRDLVSSVRLTTDKDFILIRELAVNSEWFNFTVDGQVPLTADGLKTMFDSTSMVSLSGKFNARLSKAMEQFPDLFGHSGMTVRSGDITGQVTTSHIGAGKVFYGNVSLANFSASNDEKTLKLNTPITLRTEILAKPEGVFIDPIEISSVFMNLSCSGYVDDLKIQGVIPLSAAQNELGNFVDFGPYSYTGEIVLNANMMPKDRILNGKAFLKDFTSTNKSGRTISEPYADLSFGMKHDPIEERLWITSLFFKSALLGELEILQGYMNMKANALDKFVTLFKYRSNIAKIFEVLTVYNMKPDDLDASGQFFTTTRLAFGDKGLSVFSDDINVTDMTVKKAADSYHTAGIKMAVDVNIDQANGTYTASDLQLKNEWLALDFSKCNYISNAGQNSLDAEFTLAYNLETMALVEKFLPENFTIKGSRKTNCYIRTSYPTSDTSKALANLDATIGLGFDSMEYMGLVFGSADIKSAVKGGKLVVEPFGVSVNEGTVNFGASADLAASPIVLNVNKDTKLINAVKINDDFANGLLKYLNPVFSGSVNSAGHIDMLSRSMQIPLGGDIAAGIIADAQISVKDVRVAATGLVGQIMSITGISAGNIVSFRIEPSDVKVAASTVSLDNMVMFIAEKKVAFKGSTGFDGQINMDITLPIGYSIDGKKYPEISLPIDGNVSSPRIDTRKIIERNTDVIGDVIEKAIDKNVDDDTGRLIREGIRGLQDLLKKN